MYQHTSSAPYHECKYQHVVGIEILLLENMFDVTQVLTRVWLLNYSKPNAWAVAIFFIGFVLEI